MVLHATCGSSEGNIHGEPVLCKMCFNSRRPIPDREIPYECEYHNTLNIGLLARFYSWYYLNTVVSTNDNSCTHVHTR